MSSSILLASESTWRLTSVSRLSSREMRLWAKLRSLRFTNLSRPSMISMLLKERSNHSRWTRLSSPVTSSMMLLSSWSFRRDVNCQRFSIRRMSVGKIHHGLFKQTYILRAAFREKGVIFSLGLVSPPPPITLDILYFVFGSSVTRVLVIKIHRFYDFLKA